MLTLEELKTMDEERRRNLQQWTKELRDTVAQIPPGYAAHLKCEPAQVRYTELHLDTSSRMPNLTFTLTILNKVLSLQAYHRGADGYDVECWDERKQHPDAFRGGKMVHNVRTSDPAAVARLYDAMDEELKTIR